MRRALGWGCLALMALSGLMVEGAELDVQDELETFISQIAERHGFEREALRALFASVRWRSEILEAMDRQRETVAYHEYRKQFLTAEHLHHGLRYWERHAQWLARAEAEYGVPPEVVVAILGVETQYGRNRGGYPVLDALATLAFGYPRRATFFRRELEAFLLLCRDNGLDPTRVRGSYAGAIGPPQFLPSSYQAYAVDFDGDTRRDLIASDADIIGSIAHFLHRHGWRGGEPVAAPARVEGTDYRWLEALGPQPLLPLARLEQYGVSAPGVRDTILPAALVRLEGEDGPRYLVGFRNFYVLTRYNRSVRYAAAVFELSEWLREERCRRLQADCRRSTPERNGEELS